MPCEHLFSLPLVVVCLRQKTIIEGEPAGRIAGTSSSAIDQKIGIQSNPRGRDFSRRGNKIELRRARVFPFHTMSRRTAETPEDLSRKSGASRSAFPTYTAPPPSSAPFLAKRSDFFPPLYSASTIDDRQHAVLSERTRTSPPPPIGTCRPIRNSFTAESGRHRRISAIFGGKPSGHVN